MGPRTHSRSHAGQAVTRRDNRRSRPSREIRLMLGSRLVRHDHGHHPRRCSVQVAARCRRRRSARTRWAFLAYGGCRPRLRPLSKSWRRHPRPAMSGRPSNDGSASSSSTGSAIPADLVLALKAKCGLKLIGGRQPSGRLEGARIGTTRPWRRAWLAAPGRGKGGRERCQDRRDEQAVLIWRVSRCDLARAGRP
jgi:hypothetical protein